MTTPTPPGLTSPAAFLFASPIMTIDELIAKVREHLDGIDRIQDDSRGGYWQTPDGAKAGKIILRGLELMLRAHWPGDVPPLPADGEVAKVAKELQSHARHITELNAEGWPTDNDLPPLLTRAAALLQQQESKLATTREALRRLVAWGGWRCANRSWQALDMEVVLGVLDWFADGMTGPLPPLPPYIASREGLEPTPSAPALPPAIAYECGDGVRISATNSDKTLWVVWREIAPDRECLCLAGQWCIEPRWSVERDFAAFETRTRWPSAQAAWAALLEYRTRGGGSEGPLDPDAMPLG